MLRWRIPCEANTKCVGVSRSTFLARKHYARFPIQVSSNFVWNSNISRALIGQRNTPHRTQSRDRLRPALACRVWHVPLCQAAHTHRCPTTHVCVTTRLGGRAMTRPQFRRELLLLCRSFGTRNDSLLTKEKVSPSLKPSPHCPVSHGSSSSSSSSKSNANSDQLSRG